MSPRPDDAATEENPSSESAPGLPEGELSYEAAREELVQVVTRLESGGVSLAQSMELWERGEKLADTCQQWLDGARAKVEAARRPQTHDDPT